MDLDNFGEDARDNGTLNSGDDAIDPALLTIGVSNGAPPGNHVPSNGPATAEPQGTATIINPNGIHLVPAQGTFLRLDLQPEDFSVGSIHRSTAQPDLILPQQNAALQPTNGAPGGSEDEEEPSTFLVHAGIPVGFYQSFANEAEQALANLLRNYPHLASNIPPPDLDNVDLVEVGANTLGIGQPGAMPGLFGRDDPTHPARRFNLIPGFFGPNRSERITGRAPAAGVATPAPAPTQQQVPTPAPIQQQATTPALAHQQVATSVPAQKDATSPSAIPTAAPAPPSTAVVSTSDGQAQTENAAPRSHQLNGVPMCAEASRLWDSWTAAALASVQREEAAGGPPQGLTGVMQATRPLARRFVANGGVQLQEAGAPIQTQQGVPILSQQNAPDQDMQQDQSSNHPHHTGAQNNQSAQQSPQNHDTSQQNQSVGSQNQAPIVMRAFVGQPPFVMPPGSTPAEYAYYYAHSRDGVTGISRNVSADTAGQILRESPHIRTANYQRLVPSGSMALDMAMLQPKMVDGLCGPTSLIPKEIQIPSYPPAKELPEEFVYPKEPTPYDSGSDAHSKMLGELNGSAFDVIHKYNPTRLGKATMFDDDGHLRHMFADVGAPFVPGYPTYGSADVGTSKTQHYFDQSTVREANTKNALPAPGPSSRRAPQGAAMRSFHGQRENGIASSASSGTVRTGLRRTLQNVTNSATKKDTVVVARKPEFQKLKDIGKAQQYPRHGPDARGINIQNRQTFKGAAPMQKGPVKDKASAPPKPTGTSRATSSKVNDARPLKALQSRVEDDNDENSVLMPPPQKSMKPAPRQGATIKPSGNAVLDKTKEVTPLKRAPFKPTPIKTGSPSKKSPIKVSSTPAKQSAIAASRAAMPAKAGTPVKTSVSGARTRATPDRALNPASPSALDSSNQFGMLGSGLDTTNRRVSARLQVKAFSPEQKTTTPLTDKAPTKRGRPTKGTTTSKATGIRSTTPIRNSDSITVTKRGASTPLKGRVNKKPSLGSMALHPRISEEDIARAAASPKPYDGDDKTDDGDDEGTEKYAGEDDEMA